MTEYFFIGIDGGASSCRARLRDMEGNLLGEGCSGPANIHLDLDLAKESVRAASRAAVRAAGLDERILHRAHAGLGLAGAGLKSPCEQLRAGLNSFASTVVATDAYIAWLGAHQGGNGGIVILGTGSSGLAIVDGRRIDVAGWGAEISDEAGGQRMGREALRRTLWTFDGRAQRTKLSDLILDRYRQRPIQNRFVCSKRDAGSVRRIGTACLRICVAQGPTGRRAGARGGRCCGTHHRQTHRRRCFRDQSDRRTRRAIEAVVAFPAAQLSIRAAK